MAAQTVTEPLEPWVERVIDRALLRHEKRCYERGIGADVKRLRLRLAALLGFMAGSGLLGGAAGAVVARVLEGR